MYPKINITKNLINNSYYPTGAYGGHYLGVTDDGWITNRVWAFKHSELGKQLKSVGLARYWGMSVDKMMANFTTERVLLPALPSKPQQTGTRSVHIIGEHGGDFDVDLMALLQFGKDGHSATLQWDGKPGRVFPSILRADGNVMLMGLRSPLGE